MAQATGQKTLNHDLEVVPLYRYQVIKVNSDYTAEGKTKRITREIVESNLTDAKAVALLADLAKKNEDALHAGSVSFAKVRDGENEGELRAKLEGKEDESRLADRIRALENELAQRDSQAQKVADLQAELAKVKENQVAASVAAEAAVQPKPKAAKKAKPPAEEVN